MLTLRRVLPDPVHVLGHPGVDSGVLRLSAPDAPRHYPHHGPAVLGALLKLQRAATVALWGVTRGGELAAVAVLRMGSKTSNSSVLVDFYLSIIILNIANCLGQLSYLARILATFCCTSTKLVGADRLVIRAEKQSML